MWLKAIVVFGALLQAITKLADAYSKQKSKDAGLLEAQAEAQLEINKRVADALQIRSDIADDLLLLPPEQRDT